MSTPAKVLVVGGALVTFGGFFLFADAEARQGRLDGVCVDKKCPAGKADDIAAFERSAVIGGTATLVGIVAICVGVAIYNFSDKPKAAMQSFVVPGGFGRRF